METINKAKVAVTFFCAGLSAVFGWLGWLMIAFVTCLFLDYLTGTWAACRQGAWSSAAARDGLWHKLGSIVSVVVAAIADGVIGIIINNIPALALPFDYTVLICPIVVVWYIFTELGSIAENAEKLGAPLPPFLHKILAVCRQSSETPWDKIFKDKKE